jgi:2-dehydro-3-deoxyglucarate aldolase/4-hydroxy-2-oxoheptanedioate aldolase
MGRIGDTGHPQVAAAIAGAAARCRALGKPCGILAPDVARASQYREYGFTWVATGSDLGLMMAAARRNIELLRDASAAAPRRNERN